ncbi:cell division protein FtsQ/DivIB [Streptomyces sp. BI20]|uniref:cell division protein FtsQ/DivIB n=1 Tax=Streptomyces sp. BI20 TaxID=3403460 RepID=UPI003C78FF10
MRILLGLAAVTALAGGGLWAVYGSTWLRVERVTAGGTEVLTPEAVTRAAGVPLGVPLASVDTDAVAARVRDRLPRVDSVEVTRSWPHGIGVEVVERKPVLLVAEKAGWVEIDHSGVRFDTVKTPPKGIPRLDLAAGSSPSLRRFDDDRLVEAAVRVAVDLPGPVAARTGKVTVRSYDSITLALTGGRTVLWGSSDQGEAKGRALTAVLKAAPKARHFDVSAPSAPAVSGS